jgi:hypothetical protein
MAAATATATTATTATTARAGVRQTARREHHCRSEYRDAKQTVPVHDGNLPANDELTTAAAATF